MVFVCIFVHHLLDIYRNYKKRKQGEVLNQSVWGRSGWVDLGHLGEEEWLDNEGGGGGVCTKEKNLQVLDLWLKRLKCTHPPREGWWIGIIMAKCYNVVSLQHIITIGFKQAMPLPQTVTHCKLEIAGFIAKFVNRQGMA